MSINDLVKFVEKLEIPVELIPYIQLVTKAYSCYTTAQRIYGWSAWLLMNQPRLSRRYIEDQRPAFIIVLDEDDFKDVGVMNSELKIVDNYFPPKPQ